MSQERIFMGNQTSCGMEFCLEDFKSKMILMLVDMEGHVTGSSTFFFPKTGQSHSTQPCPFFNHPKEARVWRLKLYALKLTRV